MSSSFLIGFHGLQLIFKVFTGRTNRRAPSTAVAAGAAPAYLEDVDEEQAGRTAFFLCPGPDGATINMIKHGGCEVRQGIIGMIH